MAGRVQGKVAFITGAARSQGRSHAIRLAQEGADIVAVDICAPQSPTLPIPFGSQDELDETARLVEKEGGRCVTAIADVRDQSALDAAVARGIEELGHIDIVSANAGVMSIADTWEMSDDVWQETIDINLTGVWRTAKAVVPHMIERRSGSIIITTSSASVQGFGNIAHYVAAKHGALGLMRTMANELGQYNIRVNAVAPSNVDTILFMNKAVYDVSRPDLENPGKDDIYETYLPKHILPAPWQDVSGISNAVLFLASDESATMTGVNLPVDQGKTQKNY